MLGTLHHVSNRTHWRVYLKSWRRRPRGFLVCQESNRHSTPPGATGFQLLYWDVVRQTSLKGLGARSTGLTFSATGTVRRVPSIQRCILAKFGGQGSQSMLSGRLRGSFGDWCARVLGIPGPGHTHVPSTHGSRASPPGYTWDPGVLYPRPAHTRNPSVPGCPGSRYDT